MAVDTPPSASLPFQQWQRAVAELRSAEARGAPHAEILRLSAEVIRTRNAMTVDRLQAGWQPPDDILKHLVVDDQLLRERDDTAASPNSRPSTADVPTKPHQRPQAEDASP
ncbi:MAG TPA: hypothetical protein VIJ96_15090 [Acidothermaceae bacterium]